MSQDKDKKNIFDPSGYRHHTPVQIRFNDIDILGHLNNTVYFSLFDTGKAYYFNAVRRGKMDWKTVDTVIANINCSFISSVVFGENVEVFSRCEALYDKSFLIRQVLVDVDTMEVKTICETVMVSFDVDTRRPCSIPQSWRDDFKSYEKRPLDADKPLSPTDSKS